MRPLLAALAVAMLGCATARAPRAPVASAAADAPLVFVDSVTGFPPISSLGAALLQTKVSGTLWVVGPSSLSVAAFVERAVAQGQSAGCDLLVDATAFELSSAAQVKGLPPGHQLFDAKDRVHSLVAWRFLCSELTSDERERLTAVATANATAVAALTPDSKMWDVAGSICRLEKATGTNRPSTACFSRRTGYIINSASAEYLNALGPSVEVLDRWSRPQPPRRTERQLEGL